MPSASYLQSSFLGGEFSPQFQGRLDDPRYRAAMNICQNGYPLEEGAWTRRAGTAFVCPTRNGAQAILREFHFSQAQPYIAEFTPGHLRLIAGGKLVLEGTRYLVTTVSGANPAVVTTNAPNALVTGDQIEFIFDGQAPTSLGTLAKRQFAVTVLTSTTFSISDPLTGAGFDGSSIAFANQLLMVGRVLDFPTPYRLGDLLQREVRLVQGVNGAQNEVIVLTPGNQPYTLAVDPAIKSGCFGTFTFAPTVFVDGPYLDIVADGSILTPSGLSGIINVTVSYPAYAGGTTYGIGQNVISGGLPYTSLVDNNTGNTPASSPTFWAQNSGAVSVGSCGFLPSDFGRMVRMFSEPLNWASGTAYVKGNFVKYGGTYWQALGSTTGVQPDSDPTNWAIATTAAKWTWGVIVTYNSPTSVSVQIKGDPLLYVNSIFAYQLGLYHNGEGPANSGSTGASWPSCGAYHEGRLWLAGAQPNRIDGSVPNNILNFAPTGPDGTVADNNACAEVLNASDVNTAYWLISNHQGLILGTQGGEWLIQASALNDPITPTSIQAHRVTKFGCEYIQPVETPLSTIFVQRYNRNVIEYISDVYSGKFSGTHLAIQAKHLTAGGIVEICYQSLVTPTLWMTDFAGQLISFVYKRESPFGTQPASFSAGTINTLGNSRTVFSLAAGGDLDGEIDATTLCTVHAGGVSAGPCWIEVLQPTQDALTGCWFVDSGVSAVTSKFVSGTPNTLVLYGYYHLAGQSVDVMAGGIDMGQITVSALGTITVPLDQPESLLTTAYVQGLAVAQAGNFGLLGTSVEVPPSMATDVPPVTTAIGDFEFSGGGAPQDYALSVDWDKGVLYTFHGDAASDGLSDLYTFDIASRAQLNHQLIGGTKQAGPGSQFGIGTNTILYLYTSGGANGGEITLIDSTTLQVTGALPGSEVISIIGPPVMGSPQPAQLLGFTAGGDYLLSATQYSLPQFHRLTLYNLDTATTMTLTDSAYLQNSMCSGRQTQDGGGVGVVFVIGNDGPSTTSGGTSNAMGLMSVVVNTPCSDCACCDPPTASLNVIGTIPPTAFGAGLLYQQEGMVPIIFDSSDGNLICQFALQTSGGSPSSGIAKINTKTAAVMWQISGGFGTNPFPSAFQSRIRNGKLGVLNNVTASTTDLVWIDTIAGTIISTTTIQGVTMSTQVVNGASGQIIFFGNLTSASGHPTPIGTTPSTFSNRFATFYGNNPSPMLSGYFGGFLAGYSYTSQGQLLRPLQPQETGAVNGPALGKTRRSQEIAVSFVNSQGVSIGTDFTTSLHAAAFASPGGTPYTKLQLFSDIYWTKLEDNYSFNSQPTWQITRPYPVTINAVEVFLSTQDR